MAIYRENDHRNGPRNGIAPIGFGGGGGRDGPRVARTRAERPSFRAFPLPIHRGSWKLEGVGFRGPMANFDRLDLRRAPEIARAAIRRGVTARKMAESRTGSGISVISGPVF